MREHIAEFIASIKSEWADDQYKMLDEKITSLQKLLVEANEQHEKAANDYAAIASRIEDFDVSEYFTEDDYEDMLDECHGDCTIAGMQYTTSRVLKEVDPVAYRCGYSDYIDSIDVRDVDEYRELQEELQLAENDCEYWSDEIEALENDIESLQDYEPEDEDE